MKLHENDLVFVLSQIDPGDPEKWEDQKFFEDEIEIIPQNQQKKSRSKAKKAGKQIMQIQEETQLEFKPFEQNIGSKQAKQNFDKKIENLIKRISQMKTDTIDLKKRMNYRNSSLVMNIASSIQQVIHDAQVLEEEYGD